MSEFGRAETVTETKAAEIKAKNKTARIRENKELRKAQGKIEDFKMSKELGITTSELNKERMYQ